MRMTLRLTDQEAALLRREAEREGRSMDEVVRLAILERIERHDRAERVRDSAGRIAAGHPEILDRLKDAGV